MNIELLVVYQYLISENIKFMMQQPILKKPKVFVSYSWTTPEHEDWVLDLARALHHDDIDVVLDKWDLRPGHDSIQFMEAMVLDPSITKIIMVIDEKYSERANDRSGGVGIESTILSQDLYSKKASKDIVAVIAEPGSKPPLFYASRIYIDLSKSDTYPAQYQQLVRWLYDRFEYERPKTQGQRPSYITEENVTNVLLTELEYRFALDSVEKGKTNASGMVKTYLDKFHKELSKLSIQEKLEGLSSVNLDEAVKTELLKSFQQFQLHIREFKILLNSVCTHFPDQRIFNHFKNFLESNLNYLCNQPSQSKFNAEICLFEIINYQLLLSVIAILVKNDELNTVKDILDEIYIFPAFHIKARNKGSSYFNIFAPSKDKILNILFDQDFIEPIAELFKNHTDSEIVDFNDLREADALLYFKYVALAIIENKSFVLWHPHLGITFGWDPSPLKIFIKAGKKANHDKLVEFFNARDLLFLFNLIPDQSGQNNSTAYIPFKNDWGAEFDIRRLINYDVLMPIS